MLRLLMSRSSFPRMYASTSRHIAGYKFWSGYDAEDGTETELGKDEKDFLPCSEISDILLIIN